MIVGRTIQDRAETYLRATMENDDSHVLVRELLAALRGQGTPDPIQLRLEDTRGLSQGVPLTEELLCSIAISLKRLADQQDELDAKLYGEHK